MNATLTKQHYIDIKKSKRNLIYKVNNSQMYLQKIRDRNFDYQWTDRSINKNIRKKLNKEKEKLKLQALLNICSKSKNRHKEFTLNMSVQVIRLHKH